MEGLDGIKTYSVEIKIFVVVTIEIRQFESLLPNNIQNRLRRGGRAARRRAADPLYVGANPTPGF